MSAWNRNRTLTGSLRGAALSAILLGLAGTATAAMDIPDSPLFLTGGAKPNLIMAIDDSGSMDTEVLFPTNDGAAWWRSGASGTCTAGTANTFTGCVSNATGTADVPGAGRLNFNFAGNADGTWKKFVYLFPNGSGGVTEDRRRMTDSTNDHFAIPPIRAFAWARSPEYNAAYFDPADRYLPWPNGGGYTFTDATATATRYDPVYGTGTINLTRDIGGSGSVDTTADCTTAAMPGVADNHYFKVYTGMVIPAGACIRVSSWANWERVGHGTPAAAGDCVIGTTNGCPTRNMTTPAEFNRTINTADRVAIRYYPATVFLSAASGGIPGYSATPAADGLTPDGSTLYRYEIKSGNFSTPAEYNAAMQNFANWFQYYRKRHQALRAGLGQAFYTIGNMRIDGFRISANTANVTMRDIDTPAQRTGLYQDFYYNWTGNGGTPNRAAVANIIRNFRRTNAGAPVTHSCQRNFGMLFTDGYSDPAVGPDPPGNADGAQGAPYADTASDTMADRAMSAYLTPLRTGGAFPLGKVSLPAACADAMHSPSLDCNPNLHMNFYAVTLGARGLLFNPDSPADPYATPPAWPTTFPARHPSAVDDIWHATINGRGQLLNASRASELAEKLRTVLNSIIETEGSASAASVNSGSINTDTRLYQASFMTRDWSGELRAFDVRSDDPTTPDVNEEGLLESPVLATIPDHGSRRILTINTNGAGVPFRWANLDATRQASLQFGGDATLGSNRLDFLRGDRSLEQPGPFRRRGTVLGDIVGSAPFFVGAPPFRYPDALETASYAAFKTAQANRQRMIYVGANDGMLHAFRTNEASDGSVQEVFAFVPGAVYDNLHHLTDPDYSHRFYVDGTVNVVDAFFSGDGAWHSVLVGGLNKGGKGVYALDVTNPLAIDEDDADDVVLWERTSADAGFADLGYTFSRPTVARVRWGTGGKWVAIFGNGYDSTAGRAVLYVVDLETGALIRAMEVSNPASPAPGSNGLSTPAVVDIQGDGNADYVYVGDLYGNMWKFNLTSPNSASWSSSLLFAAGTNQPITGRPQVGAGPYGIGMMVLFGTGKYLESSDRITAGATQTFYGILDPNTASYTPPTRANLLQQTVLGEATAPNGLLVRVTSANSMTAGLRGWYIDLPTSGERQVTDPVLRNGRIVFTTVIPSSDPCSFGGRSWLMDLDALSGSRLPYTPFDLNGDDQFNQLDYITVTIDGVEVQVPASGVGNDYLMSRPAFVTGENSEYSFTTDTGGSINTNRVNPGPAGVGRQSWRQLR